MKTKYAWATGLAISLILLVPATSSAGLLENIERGLHYIGLDTTGSKNYYGGGYTLDFAQQFVGTEYDLGNTEFTLNGALVGQLGYTTQCIPEIEFSLSTPGGISFDMVSYSGFDKITIDDGLFNIEQDFSINMYGFYDLQLFVSGTADVVTNGNTDEAETIEFAAGPIDVHSHWLMDVLNVILYSCTGEYIPFGAFEQIVLADQSVAKTISEEVLGSFETASMDSNLVASPVPEPASIVMLLTALSFVASRRRS